MRKGLIGFAVALLASAANSAPILVSGDARPAVHVSFGDLNLASSDGRARFEGRIRAASENLCANPGDRSLDAYLNSRSCYDSAVASGLRQMNSVLLQQQASASSAVHRGAGE